MTEDRGAVGRLFGAIVPRAVDAVDPEALMERIDVDALMNRVDIDGLMGRVDVDGLIQRVDVDGIITRVDIDALLTRIDIDALLARIDVEALMGRIDLNALLTKVDLNALLADVDLNALLVGVDLDALLTKVDLNELLLSVDLDRLVGRMDVKALVDKAGIEQIIAEASTGVAARTLDLARRQILAVDLILLGVVDRVLRRRPIEAIEAPVAGPGVPPAPVGATVRFSASGRPAGPIGRGLAFLVDSVVVSLTFGLGASFLTWLVGLFLGDTVRPTDNAGRWWAGGLLAWWFAYLWVGLVIAGRSVGKALLGLRVQAAAGGPLGSGRAALRIVVFPLSFILGLGFLLGIVRRDRRTLHDLISGSQEVVDWGDRRAEIPSALDAWVRTRRPDLAASVETTATPVTSGAPAPS